MKLSNFGQKFTSDSGILELMDDLGHALAGGKQIAMLGGGNPAAIPAVQEIFEQRMREILRSPGQFRDMITNYDPPRGNPLFIAAIVKMLNDTYDWNITPENVVVTGGSQLGFFTLFNLLAGQGPDGLRRILFPLVPEYIGYADQGIEPDMFVARRPTLELRGEHTFKYAIDFDHLEVGPDHAAIAISRPTNPSGNVVTNAEVEALSKVAAAHDIPLIIDNAYGLPFPGVIFGEARPIWNEHIVYSMSLSKIGLPSSRVGIFIASPEITSAMSGANAILSLANPSFGQVLATSLIEDGSLVSASSRHIRPYYEAASAYARRVLHREMRGLPYRIHEHEGAYFLWLWLEGLPITTRELYSRLKARGVITVPGEYFFPGLDDPSWNHQRECLRINFARPQTEIDAGFPVLAQEIRRAYK
jgi:valine--pyruvate aminotransferase